jgi:TRAP-type C4-dicarboxylate transport system substrate-binding protein
MLEEFIEGEYYFRISEEALEDVVAKKLEDAGINYVELVKEENQYTKFATGAYHIKTNYENIEELLNAGYIKDIEKVPKVQVN